MQLKEEDLNFDFDRSQHSDHQSLNQLSIPSKTQNSLKFDVIVKFFNKVASINGRQKPKFIKAYVSHLFKSDRSPSYIYGILRLILPAEDRERGNYGVKEKSLAVLIKDSIGLPPKQYQRLKHYKNPSYNQGKQGIGDFPLLASTICSQYCAKKSTITIEVLNKILDDLVLKIDSKDQTLLFIEILKQCTTEEILWIIRIILKDTKLGIKTQTILSQYHPDAQQYFNLTNSLKQVANKFENKDVSLKSEIMLFYPIKPMLAGKKPLQFFNNLQNQYLLETKFDGERLQAHITKDQIKLFSRNAKDYTHIYRQLVPLIRQNVKIDACILDGQVLILQSRTLKMIPFGMNKQVALNQQQNPQFQICYKVFDCLWIKCQDQTLNLMECQLTKRKQVMTKFVSEIPGRLEIVKGELVDSKQIIIKRFQQSIQRNEEGIILKDIYSTYSPAQRSTNWIKLKGDYYQGLNDTLDIMIIGGYYGDNSYRTTGTDWTDRITTFLLGVITKIDPLNPKSTEVVPFCKVGTGYSEMELNELRNRLRKHWIRIRESRPTYVVGNWKPKVDDRPDCWINSADNSVLLEVKAAEMIKSDAFGTEKTLRFPRVVKIRYDKQWNECLNFADLESFINNNSIKGLRKIADKQNDSQEQGRKGIMTQEGNKNRKQKGRKSRNKLSNNMLPWFMTTTIDQSEVVSKLFSNIQFCILNLKKQNNKSFLERKILQHSGRLTSNPVSTTTFLISEIVDFKHRSLTAHRRKYVFIRSSYVQACILQKRILDLTPLYLSYIPEQNKQYYANNFDSFGDSYRDLSNEREFDFILKNMEIEEGQEIDQQFMVRLEGKGVYQKTHYAFGIDLSLKQDIELCQRGYFIQSNVSDRTQYIIVGGKLPTDSILIHKMKEIRPHLKLMYFKDVVKV